MDPVPVADRSVRRLAPPTAPSGWSLVAAVLLLNLVFAVIAVRDLVTIREHHIQQVESGVRNMAELLVESIAGSARTIDLALLSVVDELQHELAEHGKIDDKMTERMLALRLASLPEVTAIRVTDASGTVRWGGGKEAAKPVNYADRRFFQEHRQSSKNMLIVTPPLVGRISGDWLVALTRSYRNPDGSFAGMVAAPVPVVKLAGLFPGMPVGTQGAVVLRYADRSLIARYPPMPGPAGETGSLQVSKECIAVLDSGQNSAVFHTKATPDGVERTYGFRRFDNLPFTLAVGMATREYLDDWNRQVAKTVLLLAALALVTALSAWQGRRMWLRRLADARELLQIQERYRIAFDISPDAVNVNRLEDGVYLMVNQGFLDITGYTRDEVVGRSSLELNIWADPADRRRLVDILRRDDHVRNFEARFVKKNGNVIWGSMSASVMELDGVRCLLTITRDIDDLTRTAGELAEYRDHLEEMLEARTRDLTAANAALAQARDAAEAANRAKSAFLANMSHEIRTPLNAITGMAYLIKRTGLPADQAERLDKIDKAGQHLLELINDILDLSKIEAGKLDLEEAMLSVNALVADVAAMLAGRARAKGLDFEMQPDPRVPEALLGDPTRIKQAVMNYVANAIKFTEHGAITIRTALVEEDDESVLVRCEVEDTGVGVGAEQASRLFAPFEQADNSVTRKYGGTGLGLSITRRLAEAMGGNAGVSGELGVGSRFWFTARLRKAAGTTPAS
ncbi:MAG: PAS domain S-box protein [Rhodocyclales bacterium]|nr:PAS domain S-box protein [Rhodocyclales bacterium]